MMDDLGLKDREHSRLGILNPLIEAGLLEPMTSDKPNSSLGDRHPG
jgi:hypothetical protein